MFIERALTFGASSSPGTYDATAEVVLELSHLDAGTSRAISVKQLDDAVTVSSQQEVDTWYQSYRKVSDRLGVSLASEDDPDKAFKATQHGTILGLDIVDCLTCCICCLRY